MRDRRQLFLLFSPFRSLNADFLIKRGRRGRESHSSRSFLADDCHLYAIFMPKAHQNSFSRLWKFPLHPEGARLGGKSFACNKFLLIKRPAECSSRRVARTADDEKNLFFIRASFEEFMRTIRSVFSFRTASRAAWLFAKTMTATSHPFSWPFLSFFGIAEEKSVFPFFREQ